MNKLVLLLFTSLTALLLTSNTFAADKNSFYVHSAYFKGDGKYDIVVRDTKRENLRLYINDKNPAKARANKEGWATFRNVETSGQSKVSFTKRVNFRYVAKSYVKYLHVDGKQVKLSDIGPKHSFDDYYKWVTTDRQDSMLKNIGTPHQIIMSRCNNIDRTYGSLWTACMQEGYKKYLRPETFVDNNWMGDYTDMVSYINSAVSLKKQHGELSIDKSEQYKKDMQEARKIYERIALTNRM